MNESELAALLADIESDRSERTVSTSNTDKFGEAICAFANDLPRNGKPGYLFVGADESGHASGVSITDQLLLNLGALNRAALVAADAVIVPMAADLFSLRGLRNLGPALAEWRSGWATRASRPHARVSPLPAGTMDPIGYVVLQHAAKKANEPARAYHRWIDRFPQTFHESLRGDRAPEGLDPFCLALLRHFRSLLPLALEARKPVFDLKAADGAIGSHAVTAKAAFAAFENLAREIARRLGLSLS